MLRLCAGRNHPSACRGSTEALRYHSTVGSSATGSFTRRAFACCYRYVVVVYNQVVMTHHRNATEVEESWSRFWLVKLGSSGGAVLVMMTASGALAVAPAALIALLFLGVWGFMARSGRLRGVRRPPIEAEHPSVEDDARLPAGAARVPAKHGPRVRVTTEQLTAYRSAQDRL